MTKFSVVIPVYNMGNSISNTIDTILSQTYDNYEIILVDDGSTDNSGTICDSFAATYEKIKTIHTPNRGSGPARNAGIDVATGDYVYFPDADDLVDIHIFEILDRIVSEKKYDLIVFGYRSLDKNGNIVSEKKYGSVEMTGNKIRSNYIDFVSMNAPYGIQGAPWNKLFSMKIIRRHDIQFPPLRRHQDEGFIGRYMSHVDTVKFIEDVLYSYYTNDIGKEWDKYPKDYIDAVIGLYECRKENILLWNPQDSYTHHAIELAYITGVIKALELSFSPKYDFNVKNRKAWIRQIIDKSNIKEKNIAPEYHMRYQRTILSLIKVKFFNVLYLVLLTKVVMQSKFYYFFRIIKKL